MSFLPDLAGWALRGGAGAGAGNNSNGANEGESSSTSGNDSAAAADAASAPLTAEELRAQRVARMELLQQRQVPSSHTGSAGLKKKALEMYDVSLMSLHFSCNACIRSNDF